MPADPELIEAPFDGTERDEVEDGLVSTDESFENATPVTAERMSEDTATSVPRTGAQSRPPAPSPDLIIARVSPATRTLLAELFKAEITAVRRIPRDQWR